MSINAVYEDSQGNVHESRMDGVDLTTKISIADDFSAMVNYAVGDFCYHLGTLYKCTTAHTAGAWNAAHFTATQVGDEIGELKNTLGRLDWGNVEVISTSTYTPTKPGQLIVSGITTGSNGYVRLRDDSADVIIANGCFPGDGAGIACNALVVVGHKYSSGSYNATINQFLFVPFG